MKHTSKAGEKDWESAVAMAAEQGSMLQWIQMQVWEYMDTPKLKRDGVDLAKRIYDEVSNQAIAQERERIKEEVEAIEGVDGSELIVRDRVLHIITNNHE